MESDLLGRTNQAFPPVWLSLNAPAAGEELAPLVEAAVSANTVIDISAHPALFGGFMRASTALVMSIGNTDIERATDQDHASDLLQAHLIETLSGLGREYLDFYFLRVRTPLEEFQIQGALTALEGAREEGHVRFTGIACDGPSLSTLSVWQFNDAFEVLLLPGPAEDGDALATLGTLAAQRRVGIVTRSRIGSSPSADSPGPILVPVRSATEIDRVLSTTLVNL